MIFAKLETQEQKEELKTALKDAKKSYIYRRLLILQLSSEGKRVKDLSAIFHLSELTIRNYIHTYNEGGLTELIPQPKPGRNAKLSLTKEQWEEIRHQSPCLFERLDSPSFNWTLELLCEYVYKYHGVRMTPSGIWRQLRRKKIATGRSKLGITSNDPEYTVKRQRVERLKKKPKKVNLQATMSSLLTPE